jgi:hypothetical protein
VTIMKSPHYLLALTLLVSAPAFSAQVKSEEAAVKVAASAIRKFHLTTLRDECGVLDVVEKPSYFEVAVRELHTPACGGSPETGPRLFNLRVQKRDGRITSNVYDGTHYRPFDRALVSEPTQAQARKPAR